jgi:peptidoglycan/LPS O-acetylase OafA/YrhL
MEVHFYLLVPLLAAGLRRKPGAVLAGMAACAAFFRVWCLWARSDYSMVVNQMVNFLDVYALGIALAMLWPRLEALRERLRPDRNLRWSLEALATLALGLGIAGFVWILRDQAGTGGYAAIQAGQMVRRPLLALCCGVILISLPLAALPVRLLFGNPVMRFLSGVSMNYYLLHQNIAVWLRDHGIPESPFAYPNQEGDLPWQLRYTFLAFGLSLAAAILVTYLVEKPGALLLRRIFAGIDRLRRRGQESPAGPM